MDMVEGDDFNQNYYELYEEIIDESDANWKITAEMEVHSEMSEVDIENLETIDGSDAIAQNFQDLPDELILKVLSYSKPKDLIISGQVSKRLRSICYDNSLWKRVNLSKKNVKTELLELILNKGCKSLDLSHSNILPSGLILKVLSYAESKDLVGSVQVSKKLITISWDIKSQLNELYLDGCYSGCYNNVDVLEELLASC